MTKLYVKKIWSLNPAKYIFIELDKALLEYKDWVVTGTYEKTFDEWLKTEI